jgi:hypothetical protein
MIMNRNTFFSIVVFANVLLSILGCSIPEENEMDFSERSKIALREVGNQLLLSQKDSVSLILPITKIDDFKFKIPFEKELSFEPNTLVEIVKKVLEKSIISKNYRVEVINCIANEVAYSYEIDEEQKQTLIPCAGRILPKACYTIEIKFLRKTTLFSEYLYLLYIIIPLLLGIFYRRFYLNKKPKNIEVTGDGKKISLGIFQFYPAQNKLIKKALEISLSKKECELLAIFVANKNQIVKREELTKKVWEDHGVFVGRSLDTYISKLRKKLQDDASIKLINVHGVGYKLEINS